MRAMFKILSSKINWVGLAVLFLGVYSDPDFKTYLTGLVPENMVAKIFSILGILTVILRTFFTSKNIYSKPMECEVPKIEEVKQ